MPTTPCALFGLRNTLYSFGIAHPGAIALHNFPRSLIKLERDNEIIDLSVVDIVRTRRRGVPRYNDFRAGLHRPRVTRWEELASSPEDVRLLKEIYGDIDKVDTVVGLMAEPAPTGFGFSDTAFRIFILMASRRLQSDRFLTVDFRPGDLFAVRHRLDRQQRHDQPHPAPLPGPCLDAAAHRQRVRAVAADRAGRPAARSREAAS